MAETTRKKPLAKKVTPKKDVEIVAPITKRRVTKKSKATNGFGIYVSTVKSKINNTRLFFENMPRKQKYTIFATILVLLLAFSFKNLFVVAMVNGQPITRIEVVSQLEKQNGKKTLDDLITKTLIVQEGQKNGITISDAEVAEQMKKIEDSISKQGEKFEDALAAQGITRAELIVNIRLNKTIEKLVAKSISISDKEVADYIEANKDSLPKDASPEALKKEAEETLKNEKESEKAQELVARLKKEAKVSYFINYQ